MEQLCSPCSPTSSPNEIVQYGYLAIFVLMLLESACVPIPSEVTMLFGGALASTGFVGEGRELSLLWVGLAGTLGNLVGSWIAYGAGAWGAGRSWTGSAATS